VQGQPGTQKDEGGTPKDHGGPLQRKEVASRRDEVGLPEQTVHSSTITEVPLTTTKVNHRSLASLKLPRRVSQLVTYAQGIVTSMTNNPHFPSPVPPLSSVASVLADLATAETQALTRVKGAVAARNEKRGALVSSLQQLRSYVQVTADGNPENASSIIESAGLAVKKAPDRAPRVFAAKQGTISGTVKVEAPSAGHRAAYEWEYSIDGGKTWVAMPPTLQAKTSITGLTPGSSAQFRYRWVIKTGASDWSQPFVLPLVK
jgi:hypothetical protein